MHQSQLHLRFGASVRWLLSFKRILQIRCLTRIVMTVQAERQAKKSIKDSLAA
jgi:hypothetical protein